MRHPYACRRRLKTTMKIRISAIGGTGAINTHQLPDDLDASDAVDPSDVGPLLTAPEAVVLDKLIAGSAINEVSSADSATAPQGIQAKSTAVPIWMLTPDIAAFERLPAMVNQLAGAVEAEQGVAPTRMDAALAQNDAVAELIRATGENLLAQIPFTTVVTAPLLPEMDRSPPVLDAPAPQLGVVGGERGGNGGSQSGEEQSRASTQLAWTESSAGLPENVVLGLYQPPLFNRRLETNGVDDGLLLALEAARRDAMSIGHVVVPAVPPVQRVVEIVVMAPVVAENHDVTVLPHTNADTSAPQTLERWPHIARWRTAIAARAHLALVTSVASGASSNRDRPRRRCRQYRYAPDPLLSDPRRIGAVERAACWAVADGLIGPSAKIHTCAAACPVAAHGLPGALF